MEEFCNNCGLQVELTDDGWRHVEDVPPHVCDRPEPDTSLSFADRERMRRSLEIRKHGPAKAIYISHGAGPEDWFVVEPQVGTQQSMAGTPITTEMAVESLRRSGRSVYRLEVEPWAGRPDRQPKRRWWRFGR